MAAQDELLERLVRTETIVETVGERTLAQHAEILKAIQDTRDSMEKLEAKHDERLQEVEKAFERYKGAWGLLTIIASAVALAWALIEAWLRRKLFGE